MSPDGFDTYYDLTVPIYHNYLAMGVIHHNSGKSVAAANEIRRIAKRSPGIPIAVCKYTHGEIARSIDKTLFGDGIKSPVIPMDWILHDRRGNQTLPHVVLKNGSAIFYESLTNRGNKGGAEYGLVLIDDVWIPDRVKGQIQRSDVEYMAGRLSSNVPKVRMFLTSNAPPNKDHWLYKEFPDELFLTPTDKKAAFRFRTRDNVENLRKDYEADLRATRTPEWVRAFLDGEAVYEQIGPAAFRDFDDLPGGAHIIGDLKPLPGFPLWVSWDFGFHHPAITVHQWTPQHKPFWRILYEEMGSDIHLHQWVPIALGHLRDLYPYFVLHHCCDHDGAKHKGAGAVDRYGNVVGTEIEILNSFDIYPQHQPVTSELAGLHIIQRQIDLRGGLGVHPHCETIISGLSGGLQFSTDQSGRVLQRTRDDDYLEHIMDTLRYFAINVMQYGQTTGYPTQAMGMSAKHPSYYDESTTLVSDRPWEGGGIDWSRVSVSVRK